MSEANARARAAKVTLAAINHCLSEMTRSLGMHRRAKTDADHVAAANVCIKALDILHQYGFSMRPVVGEIVWFEGEKEDRSDRGWKIRDGIDPVEHARTYLLAPYIKKELQPQL